MPKQSEVDFKVNFIKFLSSLEGTPKARQRLDRIIKRIKEPDIVITEEAEDKVFVSLIITTLFCGVDLPTFPMTNQNKKRAEDYSAKNLREQARKTASIKSGNRGS